MSDEDVAARIGVLITEEQEFRRRELNDTGNTEQLGGCRRCRSHSIGARIYCGSVAGCRMPAAISTALARVTRAPWSTICSRA